jgi:hypothetical protein
MVREWLRDTYSVTKYAGFESANIRKRITCNDGFSMSVQASDFHYCNPRKNLPDGNYSTVEIGFPSEEEPLIVEYAEDESDLTGTVYGHVPVEVVEQVIEKHRGIDTEKEDNYGK